jgi:leucyl aminopeptidase (aminopeptidase T)
MKHEKKFSAALGALTEVVGITADDNVLILSDINSKSVADAFNDASISIGCSVSSFLINENDRPLTEIPEGLPGMLEEKTIVLNILKAFPEEINFRIQWLFMIEAKKRIKCAHMPGITEDMMTEGPMNVDYNTMKDTADALIRKLKDAGSLHITSGAGTDLKVGINGRFFINDVGINPGETCNLPCGEIYCAPEESKADGVVVFDASIGDIGLLKKPLKVFIKNGKIIRFESDDKLLVKRITELSSVDDEARVIGELGIGINEGARIRGNMLEDEKAIHTAHIAFGCNTDFPGGGKNNSKIHRDYLLNKPTIIIHYNNKPEKFLMKEGEFIFEK